MYVCMYVCMYIYILKLSRYVVITASEIYIDVTYYLKYMPNIGYYIVIYILIYKYVCIYVCHINCYTGTVI